MNIKNMMPSFSWGLAALLTSNVLGVTAQISLSEIAGHAIEADCWTAVYGDVYDVTAYAPTHPAGAAILVNAMCGKDGTTAFDAVHGDTPNYMSIFPGITKLGTLVADTPQPTPAPLTPQPTPTPTPLPTNATPKPTPVRGTPAPTTPRPTPTPTPLQTSSSTPKPTPVMGTPAPTTPVPVQGVGTPAPTTPIPAQTVAIPTPVLTTYYDSYSEDSKDSEDSEENRKMLRG